MDKNFDIYEDALSFTLGPYNDLMPKLTTRDRLRNVGRMAMHFANIVKTSLAPISAAISPPPAQGSLWLCIVSLNNKNSLSFLNDAYQHSSYIQFNKTTNVNGAGYIRTAGPVKYIPSFFKFYRYIKNKFPKFSLQHKAMIFKTWGTYEHALEILKVHRPQALVFSNDHHPILRIYMHAAKILDIPTIYIQHASVSPYFPKLMFDLSLLEGADTVHKYEIIGKIEGQVELIGMPKYDKFANQVKNIKSINHIGVCGNVIDDFDLLKETLQTLVYEFPNKTITYRPHPRDNRELIIKGVEISSSKTTMAFEFLSQQDIIIAGDSSIHLEAAMLGIPSLYIQFNPHRNDYYGYVAKNLIEKFESISAGITYIKTSTVDSSSIRARTKYYNATINTVHDGQSTQLALIKISEFLDL